MFVRLVQVLQSISQSIISPNTCSLFLYVHDKSFCLSRSLPLIHPSLCFHSLARVPHAGSGLRGRSVQLLADALCKAAGVLAHLPVSALYPVYCQKAMHSRCNCCDCWASEPKWLPRLGALVEVDSENDPRPDYSVQTPNLEIHKTDLAHQRRWFCLHL